VSELPCPQPPAHSIERTDALPEDLEPLRLAAEREGFRFLTRLRDEWGSGAERFDRPGEAFFIARRGRALIGCGGVSADLALGDPTVGRVRKVYVAPDERRRGIGGALLDEIIAHSRGRFARLRLRTTTIDSARFYLDAGFAPCDEPDATHALSLADRGALPRAPRDAGGSGSAEAELIAVAAAWDRAMVGNDPEAIGRFMTEEWTIVGPDGRVGDKASFLALVGSGRLTHDTMETHDPVVRIYGDTALLAARGVSGGRFEGRAFREVEQQTCVFVRRAGEWKCVWTHLSRLAES
jgi:GNAT superfamily N-acetyltransferase/ketosteroid isomerase-like protein